MEVVLSMCLRIAILSLLARVGSAKSYGVAAVHVCPANSHKIVKTRTILLQHVCSMEICNTVNYVLLCICLEGTFNVVSADTLSEFT